MDFKLISVLLLAYGIGSIPFGYLIGRIISDVDIRQAGSGSIGATNVVRNIGLKAGLLTYIFDVVKGILSIYLADIMSNHNLNLMCAAGIAVIVGHIFPIFIGFRGGKGVATSVGVFITLAPFAALIALAVWGLIFWKTRLVSLSSIIAVLVFPLIIWIHKTYFVLDSSIEWEVKFRWAVIGVVLIVGKHYQNIKRLCQGAELPIQHKL